MVCPLLQPSTYVQNSLVHAVCKSSRLKALTSSLLCCLHCLLVTQRIKYKIAILTFRMLQFSKISCLSQHLSPYRPLRRLLSSDANLLDVPKVRMSLGKCSLSYAAPTVWKSLPPALCFCSSVPTFCCRLKN